jgi:hypothetical protein
MPVIEIKRTLTKSSTTTTVHSPLHHRPGMIRNHGLACIGTVARHRRNTHRTYQFRFNNDRN